MSKSFASQTVMPAAIPESCKGSKGEEASKLTGHAGESTTSVPVGATRDGACNDRVHAGAQKGEESGQRGERVQGERQTQGADGGLQRGAKGPDKEVQGGAKEANKEQKGANKELQGEAKGANKEVQGADKEHQGAAKVAEAEKVPGESERVSELEGQLSKLREQLATKREQLASLRQLLRQNKQTAEQALSAMKQKYDSERTAVSETMAGLRNEMRALKEDAATFATLRTMFAARCDQMRSESDEAVRQLQVLLILAYTYMTSGFFFFFSLPSLMASPMFLQAQLFLLHNCSLCWGTRLGYIALGFLFISLHVLSLRHAYLILKFW